MAESLPIKIAPSVLIWARNTIGYQIDEVARKMGVKPEKIEAWETGSLTPTYTQLENLAYKVYKRPLALFFRSSPPDESPIEMDFRNLSSSEVSHLSTEMRLVLRRAKRFQNIIRDLNKENPDSPKFKLFKVSISDNPVATANRFREFIGIPIELQKKWRSEVSFDKFKEHVEALGIYVFQFSMPFEEARAFALTDDYPVIVLNTEDAKNGRIFSLFHEVCHILFNTGGVFKDRETKGLNAHYKQIEDFCNRFAASFLVPEDLFKKDISFESQKSHEWSEEDLEAFSKLYCVSKEVILRKLVDLKLASKTFYFSKKRGWDALNKKNKEISRERLKQKQKETGKGGIVPPDTMVILEKGKPYITKVLESYNKGEITYGDISAFLDVKLDYLPKIIVKVSK